MRIVLPGEFDGTREDLESKIAAYSAALVAHRNTEGIPAPLPEIDVLRDLVGLAGNEWALASELAPEEPPPPELTYRDYRAVAYRDELGKDQGSFIKTLGDVLDTVIAQVETMRATAGVDRTPEFATMLGKIAAIKAEFPKPEN